MLIPQVKQVKPLPANSLPAMVNLFNHRFYVPSQEVVNTYRTYQNNSGEEIESPSLYHYFCFFALWRQKGLDTLLTFQNDFIPFVFPFQDFRQLLRVFFTPAELTSSWRNFLVWLQDNQQDYVAHQFKIKTLLPLISDENYREFLEEACHKAKKEMDYKNIIHWLNLGLDRKKLPPLKIGIKIFKSFFSNQQTCYYQREETAVLLRFLSKHGRAGLDFIWQERDKYTEEQFNYVLTLLGEQKNDFSNEWLTFLHDRIAQEGLSSKEAILLAKNLFFSDVLSLQEENFVIQKILENVTSQDIPLLIQLNFFDCPLTEDSFSQLVAKTCQLRVFQEKKVGRKATDTIENFMTIFLPFLTQKPQVIDPKVFLEAIKTGRLPSLLCNLILIRYYRFSQDPEKEKIHCRYFSEYFIRHAYIRKFETFYIQVVNFLQKNREFYGGIKEILKEYHPYFQGKTEIPQILYSKKNGINRAVINRILELAFLVGAEETIQVITAYAARTGGFRECFQPSIYYKNLSFAPQTLKDFWQVFFKWNDLPLLIKNKEKITLVQLIDYLELFQKHFSFIIFEQNYLHSELFWEDFLTVVTYCEQNLVNLTQSQAEKDGLLLTLSGFVVSFKKDEAIRWLIEEIWKPATFFSQPYLVSQLLVLLKRKKSALHSTIQKNNQG